MASSINASTTSGIVQTADTSGILNLQTANITAVTIDASQNVGIGTASPAKKFQITESTYAQMRMNPNSAYGSIIEFVDSAAVTNGQIIAWGSTNATPNALSFNTGTTERMRIDASGNLLVGATSAFVSVGSNFVGGSSLGQIGVRNSGATAGKYWTIGPNSSNNLVVYNQGTTGVYIVDGGTSWTASSDERLKTNLKPIENGLDKVNSLRSVTGRYLTDKETISRSFLIAQDVQAVLPEAVNVQEDEIGTLGVQYTDVIPLLVASIKELKAIVDTQAEQIKALQGAK